MGASEAYLAALRAAMNPPAQYPVDNEADPLNPQPLPPSVPDDAAPHPMLGFAVPDDGVDYAGITVNGGDAPTISRIGVPGSPDLPTNDPLARLESDPNGNLAPLTQAQALGLNRGSIAPRQPEAIPSGKMVPVFNSLGEQIGEKPESDGTSLVKSPFSHGPVVHNATSGRDVDTETGKDLPAGVRQPKSTVRTDPAKESTIGWQTKPAANDTADRVPLALNLAVGGGKGSGGPAKPYQLPADIKAASDERRAAIGEEVDAEILGNAALEGGHQAMAKRLENEATADEDRANDVAIEAHRMEKAINAQSKMVSEMKIDPDRYWRNANTGQQLLYILASTIGGFGQGFTGRGENEGLEMGKRLVDQDIMAQRQDIESGNKRIEDMKGGLADFYKRTHNMDQAVALAQAKGMDVLKEKTSALLAGSNDATLNAKKHRSLAEFDLARAQYIDDATKAEALARAKAAAAGSGTSAKLAEYTQKNIHDGMTPEDAKRAAAYALGLVGEDAVRGVHGGGKEAHKGAEIQAESEEANTQFDEMLADPVLAKSGLGNSVAGGASDIAPGLTQRLAPDTVLENAAVADINLRATALSSMALKRSEGRIPPSMLLELHHADIKPGDTYAVATAKLARKKVLVNTLFRMAAAGSGGKIAGLKGGASEAPKGLGFSEADEDAADVDAGDEK